jgi:chromosome segregation ATPase
LCRNPSKSTDTPSAERTTQLGQQLTHAQQMKVETDLKAANKRLSEVGKTLTDLTSEKEEGERKRKASEALVGRLLEEQKSMTEQVEQLSNKTKEGDADIEGAEARIKELEDDAEREKLEKRNLQDENNLVTQENRLRESNRSVNEHKTRLGGEIATLKEDAEKRGDRINVLSLSTFRQEKERSMDNVGRLVAQRRALTEGCLIQVILLTVDLRVMKEKANAEAEKNVRAFQYTELKLVQRVSSCFLVMK